MSDDGWWARKLGRPQGRPTYPVGSVPGAPPPYQPPIQYVQQQPQQPQPVDTNQIQVTTHNLFEAAAHWRGGPAHRTDRQDCPNCGSNQFFSRAQRFSRLPPPAPHCYNCGFNGGLFEQGDPSAWGYTGALTGEQSPS